MAELVIGIDLGTTNSAVASVHGGSPTVIPNRSGYRLTPSVVALARNGKRLVGALARRQAVTNAERTVVAVKRLMGRRFSSKSLQESLSLFREASTNYAESQLRALPQVSTCYRTS